MTQCGVFAPEVKAAIRVVAEVSKTVEKIGRRDDIRSVTAFDDSYNHPVVVSEADLFAQRSILTHLGNEFPSAHFLAEEKPGTAGEDNKFSTMILNAGSLVRMSQGITFGVDPIDGSSQFNNLLWEWAVSVGVMVDGSHLGGVISAPALRGGIMVYGERDKGVFLAEYGKCIPVKVSQRAFKNSLIYTGSDIAFLGNFNKFVTIFAQKVLTTRGIGSCAVGLAAVAAGRVDALIQPVQKPWDWFAGYPLVEEAGGKFQFYHYRRGKIEPLTTPDLASYSSVFPNVAFIAGNHDIVDWLFGFLLDYYGQ